MKSTKSPTRIAVLKTKAAALVKSTQPATRTATGAIKPKAPAKSSIVSTVEKSNGQEAKTLTAAASSPANPMVLKIGDRSGHECVTIADAQRIYSAIRDESGEGASTFPNGGVYLNGTLIANLSYNGRAWDQAGKEIGETAAAPEPVVEAIADPTVLALPLNLVQAALAIAPKSDSRPFLNGVRIHEHDGQLRIVASDGDRLLVINVQGVTSPEWAGEGLTLPTEELARVVKFIGDDIAAKVRWAAGLPRATIETADGAATFYLNPVEGSFPDYQHIVNKAASVFTSERETLAQVGVSSEYMKAAGVVAAKLGSDSIVPYISTEEGQPMIFTFPSVPGAVLYIMPLKLKQELLLPAATVRQFAPAAMKDALAALKEQIARTDENAKKAKHAKFRDLFRAKSLRLQARAEELRAASSVKLEGPKPAPVKEVGSASKPNA